MSLQLRNHQKSPRDISYDDVWDDDAHDARDEAYFSLQEVNR